MSGGVFTKSRAQIAMVHTVRLGYYLSILLAVLLFQSLQPQFVSLEILTPLYLSLVLAFCVSIAFTYNFDQFFSSSALNASLFAFDSFLVTFLLATTGLKQSVFFFFYLVNIILCSFVFGRKGAWGVSTLSVLGFVILSFLGTEVHGQSLAFLMTFNIFAFVVVGYLAGMLSEQLNFMDVDIARLQDLNELIVGNVGTGLMTLDPSGRVIQINTAGQSLLDSGAEIIGQNIDIKIPNFMRRLQNHMDEQRESIAKYEFHFEDATDTKILAMTVSPLKESETHIGYIVLFEDATQFKKMELAIRQSEKLAAVGALASGIAHEIRNPLASISGSIQMLQGFLPHISDDQKKLMSISMKEIDRLNDLISEFLEYVRPEKPPTEPVDIVQVLREVTEMVRFNKTFRNDVVTAVDFKSTGMIAGHFDKLKQAFLNIVINAYQAMEKQEETPRLFIRTFNRDGNLVVSIKDNGPGMEEKTLKRLFEPFHTTKAKGTGLGLAVTHKIFESHGAKVFVESRKGEGAEFIIEFPELPSKQGIERINKGRAS